MAALSEIEKLEARWAENPDGRYFAPLADAYRKAGRIDEAITVATGGLAKHPDYLSAHIVLGRCFLARKDDGSAKAAFERVLALDGENIIALKSLAEIAERENQVDDARRWLQRLLTIDAMNAEAAEDLARLGGPIEETAQAAAPAAEPAEDARISFADLAPEPVAAEHPPEPQPRPSETTAVVPAIEPIEVPRTLERPAISAEQARMAQDRTLGIEAVPPSSPPATPADEPSALGVEPAAFAPPPADEAPASPPTEGFQSFDDQLQWGAGERQSRAIHAEDIAEAEAHHEATSSAINFMGSEPPAAEHAAETPVEAPAAEAQADETPLSLEPPPEAPAAAEPMTGVEASPEPMALEVSEHDSAPSWESQHASSAAFLMPEAAEEPAPTPEPEPVAPSPAHDLPLIMPEDVTPPDELRRPSLKQVQMVSPEPVEPVESGASESDALLITETMGDLYFRQGLKEQAAAVYRRLLSSRPGDAGLQAKLSAIESPPAFSAAALGAEAVGSWLRRVASAQLPTAAPGAPPVPEAGQTPMEQAFQASEPDPAPEPQAPESATPAEPSGSPARPATDNYSLDQIFGSSGAPAAASAAPVAPQAPAPAGQGNVLGASFDEFFGAAPKTETVRPKEATPAAARQSEDDLSAFNAWLHGLKR